MTNLKEQFYQTKNIEFLKKTLGRELWVQVSGSKDINGASAAFWAALMPVENIDEAYRDYSWNSYIGTQCPGFIEYGDKIEHYPCFELFYRNTGGFLFGKPCDTRLSVLLRMANVYRETSKLRRCFHTPASLYEHGFSI